ncbi:MAG: hypothetical protein VYD19_05760 [Myxococcota bacterium]|nr:hypothetical protein [Myxococcota bacterium]
MATNPVREAKRSGDPRAPSERESGALAGRWLYNLPLLNGRDSYESADRQPLRPAQWPDQRSLSRALDRLLHRLRAPDTRRASLRWGELAATLATAISAGQRPPRGEVLAACASHFGLSTLPLLRWVRIQKRHEGWYLDRLRTPLEALLKESAASPQVELGVGSSPIDEPGAPLIIVLLVIPRWLRLDPIPRQLSADSPQRISGEQLAKEHLSLWLSTKEGAPRRLTLKQRSAHFEASLPALPKGIYQLAFVNHLNQRRGALTLWVGDVHPEQRLILIAPPPAPRLRLVALAQLYRRLQGWRGENAGRLRWSWRAQKITRFLARQTPPPAELLETFSPEEQQLEAYARPAPMSEVELQELAASRHYEVAQLKVYQLIGRSPEALARALWSLLPARAVLLDKDWSQLGLYLTVSGLAPRLAYAMTLLIARPPFHLSLQRDRASLYQQIHERRSKEGFSRLPISSRLEEVAQRVAEGLVAEEWGQKRLAERCAHLLSLQGGDRARLDAVSLRLSTPSSIIGEPLWYRKSFKSAALGLAQRSAGEPLWAVLLFRLG